MFSTAKSPQPGHHVGWSAVRAFLVRRFGSTGAGAAAGAVVGAGATVVDMGKRIKGQTSTVIENTRSGIARHHLLHPGYNFADAVGETIGFADGLDARVRISGAQERGELAMAV